MSRLSSSRYILPFLVVILNLYFNLTGANTTTSFLFNGFGKDSTFDSQFTLYGDAQVVNNSNSVQIAGSVVSSAGRFVCKEPIHLFEGKSKHLVSFSNYFAFSMSSENGEGLAFVMLPAGYPLNVFDGGSMGILRDTRVKFLVVEFDTSMDSNYSDVNSNHVGLDLESFVSVKVSNVSSLNLVLNSGEKLQSWIDYEASGKRLEVRVSKFDENRPIDPLLTYPIDLSKMWKDEDVILGLSSSNGNSTQKVVIYSWSFESRTMPNWMHSEPMNPDSVVKKGEEKLKIPKRSDCTLRIIVALVLGIGIGALGAFSVLFLWALFGNRRPVAPEEFNLKKHMEIECEKLSGDKAIKDG